MEICYDRLPLDKALYSYCPYSELKSILALPDLVQVNELAWWRAVLLLGWLDFQAKRLDAGVFQALVKP